MSTILKTSMLLIFFSFQLHADLLIVFAKGNTLKSDKPSVAQQQQIDKIVNIAQKENIKVKFKAYPWKRALLMLEKNKIDGLINASFNNKRAQYAMYPMKNGSVDKNKKLNDGSTYYIYRNQITKLRWDGKAFNTKGIVAVKPNYSVKSDLLKHPNITIEEFSTNSEILRKLAKNQIDAYAGVSDEVDDFLKKNKALGSSIIKEKQSIRKKEYFLIFSKKSYLEKKNSINAIWSGLEKLNMLHNMD